MGNFGRVIFGCFAAALHMTADEPRPNNDTKALYNTAIGCVAALIDFHLMAQYKFHNEHTIGYLHGYISKKNCVASCASLHLMHLERIPVHLDALGCQPCIQMHWDAWMHRM